MCWGGFRVPSLIVVSGGKTGSCLQLEKEMCIIGRGDNCDIRMSRPEVSRNHCLIGISSGGAWVEDLGSMNGTFVNGTRVESRTVLVEGDLIRVSCMEVRFSERICSQDCEESVVETQQATTLPVKGVLGWLFGRSAGN